MCARSQRIDSTRCQAWRSIDENNVEPLFGVLHVWPQQYFCQVETHVWLPTLRKPMKHQPRLMFRERIVRGDKLHAAEMAVQHFGLPSAAALSIEQPIGVAESVRLVQRDGNAPC